MARRRQPPARDARDADDDDYEDDAQAYEADDDADYEPPPPRRSRRAPREEFRRSTTRAIAYTALLFSLLACLLAGFDLFLTWKDGRLPKNLGLLANELSEATAKFKRGSDASANPASSPGVAPKNLAPALPPSADATQIDTVRGRLADVQRLAQIGDAKARLALDDLMTDLGKLKTAADSKALPWVARTMDALRSARDQVAANAPAAIDKLRAMQDDLKGEIAKRTTAIAAKPTPAEDVQ